MAASDKKLGTLHELVADAFTEQVRGYEEETEQGTKFIRPSASILGAAAAFLKNNNITADAEDNAALRDLGLALSARRKKKIPQEALEAAAEQYAFSMGGGLQ